MGKVNVRKRSNGWEYNFEIAPAAGKRRRIYKGGFQTKREAIDHGTQAKAEYDSTGSVFKQSEISVEDYYDLWFKNYCEMELSPVTTQNYKRKYERYIKPAIGMYKLANITKEQLLDIVVSVSNTGKSKGTITNIITVIKSAFNYAEENYYIKHNPAENLHIPKNVSKKLASKKETKVITPDQWEQIIKLYPEGNAAHLPLILGYYCGLRRGEVFGLTWDNIDFENATMEINKQMQYVNNKCIICDPKYGSSRTIDIPLNVLSLLYKVRKNQLIDKMYCGSYYIENTMNYNGKEITFDFVNRRPGGKAMQPTSITYVISKINGKVDNFPAIMNDFEFHALRHTHATTLFEAGVPIPAIQARLGHSAAGITEHYTNHVTETMREQLKLVMNYSN